MPRIPKNTSLLWRLLSSWRHTGWRWVVSGESLVMVATDHWWPGPLDHTWSRLCCLPANIIAARRSSPAWDRRHCGPLQAQHKTSIFKWNWMTAFTISVFLNSVSQLNMHSKIFWLFNAYCNVSFLFYSNGMLRCNWFFFYPPINLIAEGTKLKKKLYDAEYRCWVLGVEISGCGGYLITVIISHVQLMARTHDTTHTGLIHSHPYDRLFPSYNIH